MRGINESVRFSRGRAKCVIFRSFVFVFPPQAAALLCIPVAADRPPGTFSLAPEAFSDARRALSHLRSCIEDVCREEVDRIGRVGMEESPAVPNIAFTPRKQPAGLFLTSDPAGSFSLSNVLFFFQVMRTASPLESL